MIIRRSIEIEAPMDIVFSHLVDGKKRKRWVLDLIKEKDEYDPDTGGYVKASSYKSGDELVTYLSSVIKIKYPREYSYILYKPEITYRYNYRLFFVDEKTTIVRCRLVLDVNSILMKVLYPFTYVKEAMSLSEAMRSLQLAVEDDVIFED